MTYSVPDPADEIAPGPASPPQPKPAEDKQEADPAEESDEEDRQDRERLLPLVLTGFDEAWDRSRARLEGLTDEEYRWEPVPDCWTVRLGEDGWAVDREDDPDPPPVTTIAWRLWHLAADCLADYVSGLGPWPLRTRGRRWHPDAATALAELDAAHEAFRTRIVALGEHGIRRPLGPDWGPFAQSPWAALVIHAHDELAHHGAEIALLRDLHPRMR